MVCWHFTLRLVTDLLRYIRSLLILYIWLLRLRLRLRYVVAVPRCVWFTFTFDYGCCPFTHVVVYTFAVAVGFYVDPLRTFTFGLFPFVTRVLRLVTFTPFGLPDLRLRLLRLRSSLPARSTTRVYGCCRLPRCGYHTLPRCYPRLPFYAFCSRVVWLLPVVGYG